MAFVTKQFGGAETNYVNKYLNDIAKDLTTQKNIGLFIPTVGDDVVKNPDFKPTQPISEPIPWIMKRPIGGKIKGIEQQVDRMAIEAKMGQTYSNLLKIVEGVIEKSTVGILMGRRIFTQEEILYNIGENALFTYVKFFDNELYNVTMKIIIDYIFNIYIRPIPVTLLNVLAENVLIYLLNYSYKKYAKDKVLGLFK